MKRFKTKYLIIVLLSLMFSIGYMTSKNISDGYCTPITNYAESPIGSESITYTLENNALVVTGIPDGDRIPFLI